jgi:hypothetical protein
MKVSPFRRDSTSKRVLADLFCAKVETDNYPSLRDFFAYLYVANKHYLIFGVPKYILKNYAEPAFSANSA